LSINITHIKNKRDDLDDFNEKRRHLRTEIRWLIKIDKSQKIIKGETRDVAVDGISICSDEPLIIDDVVYISIKPQDQQSIKVYGKVVWSDLYGLDDKQKAYGLGVCFVQIAKDDRSRYHDLISMISSC
jgi:hypothetical protein